MAATSRATSMSVGAGAGWKRSVPSAASVNTPSRNNAWLCTLSWRPEPKRWITVTEPEWPSAPRGAPRPPTIPAEYGPQEHPDDGPTQGVVEGEPVAQPVGDGEHPLPDRDPGQDRLDEIRRLLRHAPPAATGADRAAFAGQRHEALERAVVAANPQEAVDEQATPQAAAELAFDEAGQADPVGARCSGGEEGLQVVPDDPVQDRVGGGARDVGSHGAGPSGFRAARQRLAAAPRTRSHLAPRRRGVAPGATARCTAGHRSARCHPLGAHARGRFDAEVRGGFNPSGRGRCRRRASARVERGKQRRGPVPAVVMRLPLHCPGRSGSSGWLRSSAWICAFSSTRRTRACRGRQVQRRYSGVRRVGRAREHDTRPLRERLLRLRPPRGLDPRVRACARRA